MPAVWVFLVGSIGFLWVAYCDAKETWELHKQNGNELAQFVNCLMYAFGSIAFIVGSVRCPEFKTRTPPPPPPPPHLSFLFLPRCFF
eukprot:SAG31_NODE_9457_length_1274_cov_1.673191_2_plen_86_part_01